MTWGSMLIGDDYDAETSEDDTDRAWVIKQLMQHPLFKAGTISEPKFGDGTPTPPQGGGKLSAPSTQVGEVRDPKEEAEEKKRLRNLVSTGEVVEGWFEDQFGKTASELIKDLRLKRRIHKDF